MQTTIRLATIMIVTTIVACGNSPTAGAANAAASDPCSLLTKEDAAAALGEAVTGPKSMSFPEVSGCGYTGSGSHEIQLTVRPLKPAEAAIYRGLCAEKGKEGLSGLGDVACWYDKRHEELQVLKGTTFVSIELRKSGDPTEAIKAAMKKVFDRLK